MKNHFQLIFNMIWWIIFTLTGFVLWLNFNKRNQLNKTTKITSTLFWLCVFMRMSSDNIHKVYGKAWEGWNVMSIKIHGTFVELFFISHFFAINSPSLLATTSSFFWSLHVRLLYSPGVESLLLHYFAIQSTMLMNNWNHSKIECPMGNQKCKVLTDVSSALK